MNSKSINNLNLCIKLIKKYEYNKENFPSYNSFYYYSYY